MISYGFPMILYGVHMVSYGFRIILYGVLMISYGVFDDFILFSYVFVWFCYDFTL